MLAYTHKRIGVNTLGDFFSLSFFTPVKNLKISNFLDTEFEGKKNSERIFSYYTETEKSKNQEILDSAEVLIDAAKEAELGKLNISFGTLVYLPEDKLYIDFLEVSQSQQVENFTTFTAFLAEEYLSLLKSPYYIPLKEDGYKDNLRVMYPDISVYLWSKSLLGNFSDYSLSGDLIDITSFVQSVSISQTKTGGSFKLLLLPVLGKFGKDHNEVDIEDRSVGGLDNFSFNIFTSHHKIKDGSLQRQKYFFSNIIQSNDIVFISFEKLKLETLGRGANFKDDGVVENYPNFLIDARALPGSIFDMMGLVDTNDISVDSQSNEIQINISGRDFTKVLIEDGCYFYPQIFSQSMFSNLQPDDNIIKRISGVLVSPLIQTQRTIQDTLDIVFSVLKTIKVCDNILFSGYDKSSGQFVEDPRLKLDKFSKQTTINDERNFILENIFLSRKSNNVATIFESDFDNLNIAFSLLEDFISFLIDSNYIDTIDTGLRGWSDSGKSFIYNNEEIAPDKYPSELQKLLLSPNQYADSATEVMYKYIKDTRSFNNFQESIVEGELEGIWKVIRFVYDQSIANRIVVDTSIGFERGSLLSFIQKICQEPFVEFWGDTYGDKYVFTVRQMPFTREKIQDLARYAIDISDSDILSENLQFTEENIFSWYKLEPRGLIGGAGSEMTLAFLNAVYFPEYAEIWGSRPLDVSHNYIPLLSLSGDGSKQSLNKWELQAVYDLKYLIDIYSYVPFTRSGTIIINGDRRIKRGMIIRLVNKGEIAYVDEVSNSFLVSDKGIDRVTTLNISRVMVEDLVNGITINDIRYSYFDLIDTSFDLDSLNKSVPPKYEDQTVTEEAETGPYNPLIGVVTSKFGTRHNPLSSDSASDKFHNGVDISAGVGTPIRAPWDGVVFQKYSNDVGGNQILIKHSNGYITGYAHLKSDSLFANMTAGKSVVGGQVFASSGNTGNTTGPHLHFTVTSAGGQKLDPLNLFDFQKDRMTETTETVKSVLVEEGVQGIISNDATKNWRVNREVFNYFIKRRFLDER